MQPHVLAMSGTEHTLWVTAIILGFVVVLAVAALLSILIWLVKIIDRRVVQIGGTLQAAADNTAPLGALRTTIEYATVIIGGLQRGRARLGG